MSLYKYIYFFKRKRSQNYQPVVLITGCASGIGLALAQVFYRWTVCRVVITSREKNLDLLKEKFKESERFIIRALDVNSADMRSSLVQEVNQKWGRIDILINNAGISYRSVVEHMSEEDEFNQMSTNYLGPMALIRLVLPKMREAGRGKIINISSVSGMLAMPTMASYSASKYALEGASEALWYEMKPFGINVSLIQPGFIHSESFKNVYLTKRGQEDALKGGPYQDFYRSMPPFIARLMNLAIATPESVADLVLHVVQTNNPPLWIPATFDAEFFYYLRRIFPRRILHPLLYMSLPNARHWAESYSKKRR